VTIHSEHPFLPPEGNRSPLRRLRGRIPSPVSIWTTGQPERPVGWTVSSFLVADGDPAEVLGLIDEDCDLADAIQRTGVVAVSLLGWQHRALADAFAGIGPAPGGPFRLGSWTDTAWGPVLADAIGWVGARVASGQPDHAGWGLLVRGTIETISLGPAPEEGVLAYLRGRYRGLDS
jgi:flavin reductase (DIM6/NTAB) family NADH-FMN oxidoreductase RutF